MPGFELIGAEELSRIQQIFDHGGILFRHSFDHLRQGIYMVQDFEKRFAERMGTPHALAVSSGTAALRVALAGMGVEAGDEVITQSFTFVATVEAIIEARAVPVVTEVDDTLNMDPSDLERKITDKTKVIIVVHMLGTPARMDEIMIVARKHNLLVMEDTAWGCGGYLNGKPLGTIGDVGTFSFDFAKTMTTGEGGMVITRNRTFHEKSAAYHDHGHENNPKLPRWEDSRSGSGFNYRMTELQGAVGLAQLEKLDQVVASQRRNKEAIVAAISDLPITLRTVPDGSDETADAAVFFVENATTAQACRDALLEEELGTKILPEAVTWHFAATWDHMPQLVERYGGNLAEAFPESKGWLDRSVSLPIVVKMPEDVPRRIRAALDKVFS